MMSEFVSVREVHEKSEKNHLSSGERPFVCRCPRAPARDRGAVSLSNCLSS